MPTYICVRCKQAIPPDDVHRDASGQTYDSGCFQAGGPAPAAGLVITDVRVPFMTIFSIVSQVLAVLVVYSLVGWLMLSCASMISR